MYLKKKIVHLADHVRLKIRGIDLLYNLKLRIKIII